MNNIQNNNSDNTSSSSAIVRKYDTDKTEFVLYALICEAQKQDIQIDKVLNDVKKECFI